MDKFEKIKQGFDFLLKDCGSVTLLGFVDKSEIPEKASKEEYDNEAFDHEFSDTRTDGFDDADFWGSIYLPLEDNLYMQFDVHA